MCGERIDDLRVKSLINDANFNDINHRFQRVISLLFSCVCANIEHWLNCQKKMAIFDLDKIYNGKKVFITGHTGFKGSWLSLWLTHLGATVYGYALEPPTDPSLFQLLKLGDIVEHEISDIRDGAKLKKALSRIRPDIIFHLAAQSLVMDSYGSPVETVEINTLGTIHVMEAVRELKLPVAVVMVTSDKCYQNQEWLHGYRETDPMGGHDPYSASKAGAELFIDSWRNSFFHPDSIPIHGVRMASARAGNVVGGGDWTKNNLVPDCIRALQQGKVIELRNPGATRPWQHVLEALGGYMLLGARLMDPVAANARRYCEGFNFGPHVVANKKVSDLVEMVISCWGNGAWRDVSSANMPHEASLLSISIDKAYHTLGWSPKLDFDETIRETVDWYKCLCHGPSRIMKTTLEQIRRYEGKDSDVKTIPVRKAMRC
jgi:CDP-glucose 4,6-dehydratase